MTLCDWKREACRKRAVHQIMGFTLGLRSHHIRHEVPSSSYRVTHTTLHSAVREQRLLNKSLARQTTDRTIPV